MWGAQRYAFYTGAIVRDSSVDISQSHLCCLHCVFVDKRAVVIVAVIQEYTALTD